MQIYKLHNVLIHKKQKLRDEERQTKGHSLTRREKDLIVEFLDERQAELEY